MKEMFSSPDQQRTNPGTRSPNNYISYTDAYYLWVLSVELASCHPCVPRTFRKLLNCLENLYTPTPDKYNRIITKMATI